MTNKLEKTLETASLFRLYQKLLPLKQQEYLTLYLDEDWSLQEIATNFQVSRNAIHDAIQKAVANLKKFEQELGFHQKEVKIQKILRSSKSTDAQKIQKMLKVLALEV